MGRSNAVVGTLFFKTTILNSGHKKACLPWWEAGLSFKNRD